MIKIDLRPDRKQIRNFGFICLGVFGLLALWVGLRGSLLAWELSPAGARGASVVLGCAAGACGLAALLVPGVLRPLYVALVLVTYPIGFVVSHVILGVLFFVVMTGVSLGLRVVGFDPLNRKLDRAAGTYWLPRSQPDAKRYLRQY